MTNSIKPEKVTKSIIPCSYCKGSGIEKASDVINYHDYYEEEWNELCKQCGGEGRLVHIEVSYKVHLENPYTANKTASIARTGIEKLAGRTTEDIYDIGRKDE